MPALTDLADLDDLTLRTDGTELRGFVFDGTLVGDDLRLRLLPPDSPDRIEVMASDVVALTCEKDPAAGKTWENWVRRYAEKKLAGESASIESESLDD